MSDILLSVGLQKGAAETSQLQADLQSIISRLDKNPPKVKVGLTVDQSALNHFKSQLTQIVNSVGLSKGAPITVNISGLGEITTQAGQAKQSLDNMASAARGAAKATTESSVSAEQAAKAVAQAAKEAERAETRRQNLIKQSTNLLSRMRDAERNWTSAATGKSSSSYADIKSYRVELESLQQQFLQNKISAEAFGAKVVQLGTNFASASSQIRTAGEQTKTLSQRLGGLASKFSAWLSVSQVIMAAFRAVKQMVSAVRDIDKAMTELKKVTNETGEAYNKFLQNASTRAKQIGASLSDVVNASADFARLGYGLEDAAKLADAALIYKNIGDGIDDITTASESIISTMQAFGIEATNVMSIVDKFNEVGNNFAISSAGIGEAMQRSAAAMASANNTIEETIALITAANTIVQNPESVGTTLKTVSMYLRAAKTEAEEAGESTDGMADSVSELRDEILALTGNEVDIQIDEDTFKSTYQILQEISQVWDRLSDVSQANLLELLGGKRNANVVSALLENFTIAEDALKTASDAAGSALEENEKQLESIEGKIAQFKAAFQTFSQNLISSETVKLVVELGTGILKVLDALQKVHLLLPTIIALTVAFKGVGMARNLSSITTALLTNKAATESLAISVSKLTTRQKLRLVEDIKAAVATKALTADQAKQILTTLGLAAADGTLTVANKGLAASFKTLQASIPVWGWIALAISVVLEVIVGITSAIDSASEAAENSKKSISELGEEFSQLKSKINETISEFRSIKESTESIIPRLKELSGGVDKFGRNVSLTDEQYKEFVGLNNQIAEMFPELNMGYDSNGNAMLALSYSADTLTKSLNNLVEAQRAAANQAIAETMPDVMAKIDELNDAYSWEQWDAAVMQANLEKVYDTFVNFNGKVDQTVDGFLKAEYAEALAEIYELMTGKTVDLTYYNYEEPWWATSERMIKQKGDEGEYAWIEQRAEVLQFFADKSNEEVKAALDALMLGEEKLIESYRARMKANWQQLNPVVSAWLETDFMYNDLGDSMQEVAKVMVSGLDFSQLGLHTAEDVQAYIQNGILLPLFNAAPEVKQAFENITDWSDKLGRGEITVETFAGHVSDAFNSLKESMSPEAFSAFSNMLVTGMRMISPEVTDFDSAVRVLAESWGFVTDTVSSTSNVFASTAKQMETVKKRLDTLGGALDSLAEGSLDVWEVIELLQQFPELAPYVDLTADNFGNLGEGLRELIRNTPDEFIETMQKFKTTNHITGEAAEHIDALCEAVSDLSGESLEDITGEFGVLAEAINNATKAQNELEEALKEDDWDAGYEGRVKAFEGFQESFDAGEYGSKAFAAYKEYFGLMEKSPAQIKEWMDANKKYFTEGTDGVLAFLQTVESMSGPGGALDGIASFDADTGEFWYDINELSAFADQLGWTEEMLQDFIYKYRMYCDAWESRSPADSMKELQNAGLFSTEYADFGPTIASLKDLMEYTGLSEQGVYDLIDSINELRKQDGLPEISLIGRDITEVTQESITRWQNLGATAEEVTNLIIDLAEQGVKIKPNLWIDTTEGPQLDVDTILAEAGIEDSETVHVEVDFTVNGEAAMATVEATVAEVKAILGEDWEVKLAANSVDAETGLTAVQTLLNELPPSTDVLLLDETGLARSSLSKVISLLDTIENNNTKTVTIRYKTIGLPMFADGTKRAKAGPALLGDEYSPSGSPKPELVVSGDRAYIAGENGPEVGYLHDGDVVYTADETKRILGMSSLHGSIPAHAGGTAGGLVDTGGLSGGNYNFTGGGSSSNKSGDDEESWFERQYKDHNHWLEMDKESVADYLEWLNGAYQQAYAEGIIDLDEYYKYQEEVYKGVQDLFKDHLNDIDHEMSLLEGAVGSSDEVIALAVQAMADIEKELAAARAAGLDENGDYIQWLEQQWANYSETVIDLREQAETEAKNSVDDLVEYRIKMLKQEIENEKDALDKKLSDLQDFYDKQRKMLQDQYDEEKYLEEQSEKRKSVTDIKSELAMLANDNSAWAQKRKLELQEELSSAEKELSDFERDHALDTTLSVLDEQQAAQEAQIQAEMDALDAKLNDPHALFNQALTDIKNNTADLYQQFIEYNRKYGTGNDQDIADMWEEAYKADLEYQDTHDGQHKDGIEIGNYTGYVVPEKPKPPEPDPTPTPPADPAPSQPSTPQLTDDIKKKVAAAIWNGGYGWGTGSTRTSRLTEVFGANNGIQALVNKGVGKSGVSLTNEYTYANMRKKFKGYASGTANATPGWHELFEGDIDEYVFTSSDGSKYRMFSGLGDKVLNGDATDFLYDFANSGGTVLTKMLADLFKVGGFGNIAKPVQAIDIRQGDVIVQGNADMKTVSEIRRAQRDSLEFMLKELNRLNK